MSLNQVDFQRLHESGGSHPKVVADHDNALHPSAVTMAQRFDQSRFLLQLCDEQPLFELINHNHNLLTSWYPASFS